MLNGLDLVSPRSLWDSVAAKNNLHLEHNIAKIFYNIGESGEKWTVGRNGPPLFSGKLMDKMCQ